MPKAAPVVHPGPLLKKRLGSLYTQTQIADQMGLSASHLSEILHGKRPLSPRICLLLESCFRLSATQWNRLQADYDLSQARTLALAAGAENSTPA